MKKKLIRISLLAILACLLWATAAACIKIGLQYAKPLLFAGMRFLLAGLILIPFSKGIGAYLEIIKKHFKLVVLVSLFQTIFLYVLFFEGLTLVPGAIGSIINGSTPLVAAVLCHFFVQDDKLTLRKLLIILAGISGIVLIAVSREPFSAKGFREMTGIMLVFGSCLCSAIGNIIIAGKKEKINPITLNSLQIGLGGIVLILLSFVFEGTPVVRITVQFSLTLIWLAMVSAAGFSIWFYLLKHDDVKVSELNIWKFIIPVFGVIVSWLLLPDEKPSWVITTGMLIVAGSIVVFYLQGRKKK